MFLAWNQLPYSMTSDADVWHPLTRAYVATGGLDSSLVVGSMELAVDAIEAYESMRLEPMLSSLRIHIVLGMDDCEDEDTLPSEKKILSVVRLLMKRLCLANKTISRWLTAHRPACHSGGIGCALAIPWTMSVPTR